MTVDETLAASRRLDAALAEAIEKGRPSMPGAGGKKLAGEFSAMLAGVRKEIEGLQIETAAAVNELMEEVKLAREVPKALRAEAAEMRKAFGEVLGNAPPEDAAKPDGST